MKLISETFLAAGRDIATWVENVTGITPVLMSPGSPAEADAIALTPWRMVRATGIERARPHQPTAMGHFCLTIGPDAPDLGCTWFDALYFAAHENAGVELIDMTPPDTFWRAAPGLTMTLARRIERPAAEPGTGTVLHPLVFDIQTNTDNKAPRAADHDRGD